LSFQLSAFSFQLYPNPTLNNVIISWNKSLTATLAVADLNGQVLRIIQLKPSLNTITVSLVDYPAGTYMFSIQGRNGVEIKKVVKM